MQLKLSSSHIWLCNQAVDFRKSVDGLCEIISTKFSKLPQEGMFIFFNRSKNKLKLLFWHGNGFILLYKRLEQARFKFSVTDKKLCLVDELQLSWILAGLDWEAMSNWKTLKYKDYF